MSSDTKWIIGTIVPAILVVAGLLSAQIAGVNARIDDVNARIGDVNARIDTLRTDVNARIDDVNARIDALRADLKGEIAVLRDDLRSMDARLRAVEVAFGKVDQRLETLERAVLPAAE